MNQPDVGKRSRDPSGQETATLWLARACMGVVLCISVHACTASGEASADDPELSECGGCSLPPMCNPDGTAPSAPCSCGCLEGDLFGDLVCTDRSCLVVADGGTAYNAGHLQCAGEEAVAPSNPIETPPEETLQQVLEELPERDAQELVPIDPSSCREGRLFEFLPFGSAFIYVRHRDDGECEVWLGGETEDPGYDGTPTQYCRFPPSCDPVIPSYTTGGPATLQSPYCTPGLL